MAILSSAFATATSFVFRDDASTSAPPPPPSTANHVIPLAPSRKGNQSLPSSDHKPSVQNGTKGAGGKGREKEEREGEELCERINGTEDLYEILGVGRKVGQEEVRRAFLGRSRLCHPDKLPHYAPATPAFQRLSYAYETISKPGSRRLYDLGGGRRYDPAMARDATAAGMGDDTLHGVLRSVFTEFMAGDFETIRVFVNTLNEGNPGLNLGDEAVDNLEGAFRRVREILLGGQKYLRLIKFELIRLYEIQHSLRALRYLDLIGRMRLTLALTRVTLEIPLVLDRAMRIEPVKPRTGIPTARAEGAEGDGVGGGELLRRGLLGPRVKGVLVVACRVLERGEKLGM